MTVLGARGHGGVPGMLVGSVPLYVAAHGCGRITVVRGRWMPVNAPAGPVVAGVDTRPRTAAAPSPAACSITSRPLSPSGSATIARSAPVSSRACAARAASTWSESVPDSSRVVTSPLARSQFCCQRELS